MLKLIVINPIDIRMNVVTAVFFGLTNFGRYRDEARIGGFMGI
jgi:hypothetical protein